MTMDSFYSLMAVRYKFGIAKNKKYKSNANCGDHNFTINNRLKICKLQSIGENLLLILYLRMEKNHFPNYNVLRSECD